MYSTAKKLSLFCGITAAINIVATLLFFLYFPNSDLSFAMIFTAGTYLITSCLISLLLTVALHSLCTDLEFEFEDNIKKIQELSKKIHELESRL